MTDSLDKVPCRKCRQQASEVVYAEKKIRQGWYCPGCKYFMPAIRRERLLKSENEK